MKIKSILLFLGLIVLLIGCTPQMDQTITVEQKTDVSPTVINTQTQTVQPSLTFTPTPTSTITPAPSYCNYELAMKVIEEIDQWQGKPDAEGATSTPNPLENLDVTEEQRKQIITALTEKIEELDQMDVPDCLLLSVGYLRASYIKMRDLFSPTEDAKAEDTFSLMIETGVIQGLFEEEYARVKECVIQGCQK